MRVRTSVTRGKTPVKTVSRAASHCLPLLLCDYNCVAKSLKIKYVGGTSQERKSPKNWEFYPLRIGFS